VCGRFLDDRICTELNVFYRFLKRNIPKKGMFRFWIIDLLESRENDWKPLVKTSSASSLLKNKKLVWDESFQKWLEERQILIPPLFEGKRIESLFALIGNISEREMKLCVEFVAAVLLQMYKNGDILMQTLANLMENEILGVLPEFEENPMIGGWIMEVFGIVCGKSGGKEGGKGILSVLNCFELYFRVKKRQPSLNNAVRAFVRGFDGFLSLFEANELYSFVVQKLNEEDLMKLSKNDSIKKLSEDDLVKKKEEDNDVKKEDDLKREKEDLVKKEKGNDVKKKEVSRKSEDDLVKKENDNDVKKDDLVKKDDDDEVSEEELKKDEFFWTVYENTDGDALAPEELCSEFYVGLYLVEICDEWIGKEKEMEFNKWFGDGLLRLSNLGVDLRPGFVLRVIEKALRSGGSNDVERILAFVGQDLGFGK
jgi:hypothetical protein